MKLYSAPSGRKNRQLCKELDVGIMIVDHWHDPTDYPYFAIDNGCFSAWKQNKEWNPAPFLHNLTKCKEKGLKPDFAVLPDIVAGGKASLQRSMDWLKILKPIYPNIPFYLAVQDGMTISDITEYENIDGLFIGGSMEWKLLNMEKWAIFGRIHHLKIHAGRIGPVNRMVMAHDVGISSIDSTTWVQCQCLEHHIREYQQIIGK